MNFTNVDRARIWRGLIGAVVMLSCPLVVHASPTDAVSPEQIEAKTQLGSYLAGRYARGQRDMETAARFYRHALAGDPSNEEILKQSFLTEIAVADWTRTGELAQRVIEVEPDHRVARILLGVQAFMAEDYEAADTHLSRASSGPIGELTGNLARAWIKVGEGDGDGAFKLLARLDDQEWARFYRNYHRGLVGGLTGRRERAERAYKDIFDADSRTVRLALAYARHAASGGENRAAREILGKHLGGAASPHPLARQLLFRLRHGEPVTPLVSTARHGMAEVFYGLGETLTNEGGIDIGIIYLRIALHLRPDFPMAQYSLGNVFEATKKYDRAIAVYGSIDPASPVAFEAEIRKAISLNWLERLDEATGVLQGVLEKVRGPAPEDAGADVAASPGAVAALRSSDENVRLRAAQARLKTLGLYDQEIDGLIGPGTTGAIRAFQRDQGLEADGILGPQTIDAIILATASGKEAFRQERELRTLMVLGNLLRGHKKFEDAAAYYTRAIELLDRPPSKNDWNKFYARGVCFERLKQWPKAEKDLQMALTLNPDQPLVLNYLGYSWVDQKLNLNRAMKLIRKAVRLKPNDGYIVDSLGWAYYRLGDFDSAVKYLERAAELRPDDPTINDHLGDAYWRVDRKLEARYQWKQSLTLDPEEAMISDIEEKLANGLPELKPTRFVRTDDRKSNSEPSRPNGNDAGNSFQIQR